MCPWCETKFFSRNSIHCSAACAHEAKRNDMVENWLSGKWDGSTKYGLSTSIRNWLIDVRGARCEECGWCRVNSTSNNIPLQIDHIDGNARNHHISNLKILCPSCHALTPTFGALNVGNGRQWRREARKLASK